MRAAGAQEGAAELFDGVLDLAIVTALRNHGTEGPAFTRAAAWIIVHTRSGVSGV